MKLPSGFYRIEGDDPDGPNVVICGGTHGDEPVGVNVVRRLLSDFGLKGKPTGVYKHELITSGALYLGFGNPVAIACETRAAAGKGPDLNRSFSRVELDQSPSENERHDLVRARELMPLFEQTDYLLDIHSTSSDSVPFVCMGDVTNEHRRLCSLIPAPFILTDPTTILSQDCDVPELGTTDYAVNTFGGSDWSIRHCGEKRGVAFAYESGQADEHHKEVEVWQVAYRFLHATGLIQYLPEGIDHYQHQSQRVFRLHDIVHTHLDGFRFLEEMRKGWHEIMRGQTLGVYSCGTAHEIMHDGMLLFPKGGEDVFPEGQAVCYIAQEV